MHSSLKWWHLSSAWEIFRYVSPHIYAQWRYALLQLLSDDPRLPRKHNWGIVVEEWVQCFPNPDSFHQRVANQAAIRQYEENITQRLGVLLEKFDALAVIHTWVPSPIQNETNKLFNRVWSLHLSSQPLNNHQFSTQCIQELILTSMVSRALCDRMVKYEKKEFVSEDLLPPLPSSPQWIHHDDHPEFSNIDLDRTSSPTSNSSTWPDMPKPETLLVVRSADSQRTSHMEWSLFPRSLKHPWDAIRASV